MFPADKTMVSMKTLIEQFESDKFGVEHYLHKLMKLAMTVTGRGNLCNDYTSAIDLEVGGLALYSDPYYNEFKIYTVDNIEMEIKNEDTLRKLANELKKRLLAFERKTKKKREEAAAKIFDKNLDHIFPDD